MKNSDIGIYGLGIMGQNLALNLANNNFKVSIFNRLINGNEKITKNFVKDKVENLDIEGFYFIKKFIESLLKPRKIIIILEGLNLHNVIPKEYELICMPMKLIGCDGAPSRVILKDL